MTDMILADPEDIIPPRPTGGGEEHESASWMSVEVAGFSMLVRKPKDGQLVLFGRYARIIERTERRAAGITGEDQLAALWQSTLGTMSDALEVLEYLIVSDEDRYQVERMMRQGRIEIADLVAVVKAFQPEPDDSTALVKQRKPNARAKR